MASLKFGDISVDKSTKLETWGSSVAAPSLRHLPKKRNFHGTRWRN